MCKPPTRAHFSTAIRACLRTRHTRLPTFHFPATITSNPLFLFLPCIFFSPLYLHYLSPLLLPLLYRTFFPLFFFFFFYKDIVNQLFGGVWRAPTYRVIRMRDARAHRRIIYTYHRVKENPVVASQPIDRSNIRRAMLLA